VATAQHRAQSLARRKGMVRSKDLTAAGIARMQLSRMVAAGRLVRVARGLYAAPGRRGTQRQNSIATVAQRVPNAVLCLLTALYVHSLAHAPAEVWIAIGNKDHAPRLDDPPLRVVRFSGPALTAGIETCVFEGIPVRVTSIAKTVADCFKFRNKIGLDVALDALREALRLRTRIDDIQRYAKICRVANVMRPYVESLT
jgi:predicted transcriptional regulator of viral defense system